MESLPDFIKNLPPPLFEKILNLITETNFNKGDIVFSENDEGNAIYFIDNGSFSITASKNDKLKHIKDLNTGNYFGEMALINNEKRSANVTALEDSRVFIIYKNDFDSLSTEHPELITEIKSNILDRQHELFLREELVDSTGLDGESLHISFKGDASMRETALFRERYTSKADEKISELIKSIHEVIINRCAHQIMVNFNSGEIRTMSIFDPFREKIHTVDKFVEPAYINRHFQAITYEDKTDLVRSIYDFITKQPSFCQLTEDRQNIIKNTLNNWKTISKENLEKMISRFIFLRNVENLYLRNVKISMIQDAIRMQFNCDGTHIIDSTNFDQFVEDNF